MQYTILMCNPDYFDVKYSINPWMEDNIGNTQKLLAVEQWNNLYAIIQSYARVELIAPSPGSPDMVFTANAALVLNKKALVSRFHYQERAGEERFFREWFAEKIDCFDPTCSFEGAGDAIPDAHYQCIWLGYGKRSDVAAKHVVEQCFGKPVIPLSLVNPSFYHLDTCLCPLPGGYILYYPPAFDADSLARIREITDNSKLIGISEEDANSFACNAVSINRVIIMNTCSAALRTRLKELNFTPVETELSEFIKAGGSSRCLTLRMDETWD